MNFAALVADKARQAVSRGNALHDGCGAVGAELHRASAAGSSPRPPRIPSGSKSRQSSGAPVRLIHQTRNPNDFAPSASQQFDETNPISPAATPRRLIASAYTSG